MLQEKYNVEVHSSSFERDIVQQIVISSSIDLLEKYYDKLNNITSFIMKNGCDCDCGCDSEGHDDECDPCLACLISKELTPVVDSNYAKPVTIPTGEDPRAKAYQERFEAGWVKVILLKT